MSICEIYYKNTNDRRGKEKSKLIDGNPVFSRRYVISTNRELAIYLGPSIR